MLIPKWEKIEDRSQIGPGSVVRHRRDESYIIMAVTPEGQWILSRVWTPENLDDWQRLQLDDVPVPSMPDADFAAKYNLPDDPYLAAEFPECYERKGD